MRAARDIAIIAVLAVPVAFVPGGGNAADAVLTALILGFLAGVGWLVYTLYRQNQLTVSTLADSRRALLYGAFGMIALMIAGVDELFETGAGTLVWIVLMAASVVAIVAIWREAHTY